MVTEQPTPDQFMQTGMGFMASRTLLSAVELELFTGVFDYIGAQFDGWAKGLGFARTEVVALAGSTSATIAYKD